MLPNFNSTRLWMSKWMWMGKYSFGSSRAFHSDNPVVKSLHASKSRENKNNSYKESFHQKPLHFLNICPLLLSSVEDQLSGVLVVCTVFSIQLKSIYEMSMAYSMW